MARSVNEVDERWMLEACDEGRKGLGSTAPNPPVGCVIVSAGREVGRGFHRRAGGPHAEIEALRRAGASARGATAYVSLEPCCHHGRTPPCTKALIAAGLSRIVVGVTDPNPKVRGRGVRQLRAAGIEVHTGVAQPTCARLVRSYSHWMKTGRSWLHLKLAASLDGRIAARGGESKWITSRESRRLVQSMRAATDAVMVGIGTVLADDPRLTCRIRHARKPLRIILDSKLCTPRDARVITESGDTLIVCGKAVAASRRRRLETAGVEVVTLETHGRQGWRTLLHRLGARGLHEVMLEGGAGVASDAVRAGMVNETTIFYNPRLIGGDGVPMFDSLGVNHPRSAVRMLTIDCFQCGDDFVWTGEPA